MIQCKPSEISSHLHLTSDTLCVLATHNYYHDREILGQLLSSPVSYIGLLGPKTKSHALLADLKKSGMEWSEQTLSKLHSPAGIDTGAESPQEIALSIITEALASTRGRSAGFLKDRQSRIHDLGMSP
jgi:xanthine/CO dehydrogenase XdhC/CoxF family maturation factor